MRRTVAIASAALMGATMLLTAAPGATAEEAPAGERAEVPPVGMSVKEFTAIVPQPYTPDPDAHSGPDKCKLYIKDYWPTAGCGGFSLYFQLHNVRDQPAYLEGVEESEPLHFRGTVDVTRTFGCRDANGDFDEDTAFEVTHKDRKLSPVYYETNWSTIILKYFRTIEDRDDFGPRTFANFPPVDVDCAEGMEPTQKDLSVTNIRVTMEDSAILGDREWTFDPLYADESTKK